MKDIQACHTANDLIVRLVGKLDNLPCTWEEFVGEELAGEVHEYLEAAGIWEPREDDEGQP